MPISMLHSHVYVACPYPRYISMSMLNVHIFMLHVHVFMVHIHAVHVPYSKSGIFPRSALFGAGSWGMGIWKGWDSWV